jgi:hypothetical protein
MPLLFLFYQKVNRLLNFFINKQKIFLITYIIQQVIVILTKQY